MTLSYIVSPKEKDKEKKRNINNDLASYDTIHVQGTHPFF